MLFTIPFVSIDNQLRQRLESLEKGLSVQFDPRVVEKIFFDAGEDQVSEKRYLILEGKKLRVSGYVQDYEPETICLRIEVGFFGRSRVRALLAELFPE